MACTRLDQLRRDLQAKQKEIQEVEQALQDIQHFGNVLEKIKSQKEKTTLELTYLILQVKEKTKALKKIQAFEDEARHEFPNLLDQWAEQRGQHSDLDSDTDKKE